MSRSIALSTRANNGRHWDDRPAAQVDNAGNADRELDAAIERADAIAMQLTGGIRELLFDELEDLLTTAARRQWSDADLARAIARASARSARLTVFLVADAPAKDAGGWVAAAVRRALRHLLPNPGGSGSEGAADPGRGGAL